MNTNKIQCKEIPNINRLSKHIGNTLNYKEITDILGIKYTSSNAKTKQLNIIQQYYKLDKVKTKYTIVDKYDEPILIVDSNQSVYYDDLEIIILYALQDSGREENTWSISKALLVTTLLNNNYISCKNDLEISAEILNVDLEYLMNFNQSVSKRFKSIFESALKRMSNKKLIDYKECTMIYKRIPKIQTNEFNIPIVDDNGKILYTTFKTHTEANESERKYILATEKQILKEYNCTGVNEIVAKGLYNTYKNKVNNVLKQKLNIEYYYKAYSIVHNNEHIAEEIDLVKRLISADNLNSLKMNSLLESKNKVLNSDLIGRNICIEILTNKNNSVNLKELIAEYKVRIKEINKQDDVKSNIPF